MSKRCEICDSGPAVLRISGLVACDNCAYDPDKRLLFTVAEALNPYTIDDGTRSSFVGAVKSLCDSIEKAGKK